MSKTWRIVLLVIVVALVAIQFIGPGTPEVRSDNPGDLLVTQRVSTEVGNLLRASCYDCHSMETDFPWYASVAPVSWRVNGHVSHGREELNFSEWSSLSRVRKLRKLKDIVEVIEEGEMPLNDYVLMHKEAKLTEDQRQAIIEWAEEFAEVIMDKRR